MLKDKKNKNKLSEEITHEEMEKELTEKDTAGLEQQEEKSSADQETNAKIQELESKVSELQDMLLRKAAEFENYKRRTENDQINLFNYAAESFIIKLLPVVDDFERSLKHINDAKDVNVIQDGVKLMYDKLLKLIKEQGVKKMDVVGKPFNVEFHDALLQRSDPSVPPHTVLEEIEPGYTYKDKVIRHAKVIVSDETALQSNEVNDEPENNSEESN